MEKSSWVVAKRLLSFWRTAFEVASKLL